MRGDLSLSTNLYHGLIGRPQRRNLCVSSRAGGVRRRVPAVLLHDCVSQLDGTINCGRVRTRRRPTSSHTGTSSQSEPNGSVRTVQRLLHDRSLGGQTSPPRRMTLAQMTLDFQQTGTPGHPRSSCKYEIDFKIPARSNAAFDEIELVSGVTLLRQAQHPFQWHDLRRHRACDQSARRSSVLLLSVSIFMVSFTTAVCCSLPVHWDVPWVSEPSTRGFCVSEHTAVRELLSLRDSVCNYDPDTTVSGRNGGLVHANFAITKKNVSTRASKVAGTVGQELPDKEPHEF